MAKSPLKTFSSNALLGGINTVSEDNDLTSFPTSSNPSALMEFRDIENWAPLERGGLQTAFGFGLFLNTGGGFPVTGIVRFQNSAGTNQFIYAGGTSLTGVYKQGSATPIATVASGSKVNFEIGNNLLVICDGVSQMQYWDGTTLTANVNASLPAGCIACVFYQNRFWFFVSVSPNQSYAYYSAPNDITKGYGDGTDLGGLVQCDVNDGQNITALAKFFLPNSLAPALGVSKSRSFGVIAGDGTTGNPYTFKKTDFIMGSASSRGVCQAEQFLFYFTHRGLSEYDTSQPYINLKAAFPGEKIRPSILALDNSKQANSIIWYDWPNFRIGCAVTEVGFTYPNVIWFYDIRYGCWYKERWGGTNNITSVFIDTDTNASGSPGTWYHGDSSGNIMIHGSTYTNFNGLNIQPYFIPGYWDFFDQSLKQIQTARLVLRGGGNVPLVVTPTFDYGDRTGPPNVIYAAKKVFTWNGGVWTNNVATYEWNPTTVINRRYYPKGLFWSVQYKFSLAPIQQNTWNGDIWTNDPSEYVWNGLPNSTFLSVFNISVDVQYNAMR